MIYGIESSTDLRDPQTVIKKFRSVGVAKRWKNEPGRAGRYLHSDPVAARNHHHVLRTIWETRGWPPTKKQLITQAAAESTRDYPRGSADMLRRWVYKNGEKL